MIVLEVERQAFGDRQQTRRFLGQVRRAAIGAAHDQREFMQRGIAQPVLFDKCIEATAVAVMAVFHPRNIVGCRAGFRCHLQYLVAGNIKKLRRLVDEAGDQPGAGDAVDLRALAGDPFHFFTTSPPAAFHPSMPPSIKQASRRCACNASTTALDTEPPRAQYSTMCRSRGRCAAHSASFSGSCQVAPDNASPEASRSPLRRTSMRCLSLICDLRSSGLMLAVHVHAPQKNSV